MIEKVKPPRYAYFAYRTDSRASAIGALSKLAVIAVVAVYSVSALALLLTELVAGVGFVLVSGSSFVVVSLARRVISAKRPYEIYDVSDVAPWLADRRLGMSFPSRHVFSAFLIGTMLVFASWPLGSAVLLLGVFIAVSRVILLVHFPHDVIAGAVIGALSGVMGALVINYLI